MSKTYLIALGICLVIGGFIGYSIHPDPKPIKPDVQIEYRYITKIDTLIIPKFRTIINTDTVRYSDTIFVHNETQYIAEIDTTYEDSTLTAHIQFVSPIKLSPKSYFNLKFNVRETTVTNTVVQTEEVGFWNNRFPVIIGVGIGYDIDRKTITPNIGLYWGIRIN